jgi:hypothetical protein
MRREYMEHGGRGKILLFHADVKTWIAPRVVKTVKRDGVKHYQDDIGGVHNAEAYDRMFGKPGERQPLREEKKEVFRRFHRR